MDTIAKIAFGETGSLQGSDNNPYMNLAKKAFRPPEHPVTLAAISLGGIRTLLCWLNAKSLMKHSFLS